MKGLVKVFEEAKIDNVPFMNGHMPSPKDMSNVIAKLKSALGRASR
jgi:hypothetical protein